MEDLLELAAGLVADVDAAKHAAAAHPRDAMPGAEQSPCDRLSFCVPTALGLASR